MTLTRESDFSRVYSREDEKHTFVISRHLLRLWAEADLWNDDPFVNWRAFDATCCIGHLLELGAPPADFEDKVRLLAAHQCKGNRASCCTFLQRHYGWLL